MGKIGLLLLAAILAGCTPAAQVIVNESVDKVKQTKDTEARLAVQVPCGIGIGAFYRVLSPTEQQAVAELCGKTPERPPTLEEVRRLVE